MEKGAIYTVVALVVTALVFGMVVGLTRSKGDYELSDENVNVETYLSDTPSVDVSHLLAMPELPEYDYFWGPAEEIEYVIYFEGEADVLAADETFWTLSEIVDEEFYFYFKSDGDWYDCWDSDEGQTATEWAISLPLISINTTEPLSEEVLEEFYNTALEKAAELGLVVRDYSSITEAVAQAKWLKEIYDYYNLRVDIILKAAEGRKFSGTEIHDVALGLGLEWDDDAYHWRAPDYAAGNGYLFSVTNEETGFIPEEMASDSYGVDTITLTFYLPYSPAPVEIYDQMVIAAKYFQERLGGQLVDTDDVEYDDENVEYIRGLIQTVTSEMEEFGFTPGMTKTMWLFF